MNTDSNPCTCKPCPGSTCTCGCQTPAAPSACGCGCQQGAPCNCGTF